MFGSDLSVSWQGVKMITYYVYNLIDADNVVRYVGKGTGRRVNYHVGLVMALAMGRRPKRATKVHRRLARDWKNDRQFQAVVIADGLSQPDAYQMECRLILQHRRETEGGTLWNVLAGGEGFQGILHDDWVLVAKKAAQTKRRTGSGRRAGAKAAATKALTGASLRAAAKAVATKLRQALDVQAAGEASPT